METEAANKSLTARQTQRLDVENPISRTAIHHQHETMPQFFFSTNPALGLIA